MPLRVTKSVARSKYGVRTDEAGKLARTVDGRRFDSAKEARRYGELKILERAGQIHGLELQPTYPLTVNGVLVAHYKPDFRYQNETGQIVVEDCKGMVTPMFKLKAKLMRACYGIQVFVT